VQIDRQTDGRTDGFRRCLPAHYPVRVGNYEVFCKARVGGVLEASSCAVVTVMDAMP